MMTSRWDRLCCLNSLYHYPLQKHLYVSCSRLDFFGIVWCVVFCLGFWCWLVVLFFFNVGCWFWLVVLVKFLLLIVKIPCYCSVSWFWLTVLVLLLIVMIAWFYVWFMRGGGGAGLFPKMMG